MTGNQDSQGEQHSSRTRAEETVEKALLFWASGGLTVEGMSQVPKELAALGAEAFPPLVKGLDHEHPGARIIAALLVEAWDIKVPALFEDRTIIKKADGVLVDGLRSEDPQVQALACIAMFTSRTPLPCVPLLNAMMMKTPADELAVFAAAALAGVSPDDTEEMATNSSNKRSRGGGRPTAEMQVAVAIRTLQGQINLGDDPGLSAMAASAMVRLELRSADPFRSLKSAIGSSNGVCKMAILVALYQLGQKGEAMRPEVERIAEDAGSAPELRAFACVVLSSISKEDPQLVRVLLAALQTSQAVVARGAVRAFTLLGGVPKDATETLLRYAKSKDAGLRLVGFLGICVSGSEAKRARKMLLARLGKEQDREILQALAEAIAASGPEAIPDLVAILAAADEIRGPGAVLALSRMGAESIVPMVKELGASRERRVRQGLSMALKSMGEMIASAVPDLTSLVKDSRSDDVAHSALWALEASNSLDDAAIQAVVQCVETGSDSIAEHACDVLSGGSMDPRQSLQAALEASQTEQGKRRLRECLNSMPAADPAEYRQSQQTAVPRSLDDNRFARLRELGNDRLLRVFLYLGSYLSDGKGVPLREIARDLKKRKDRNQIPTDVSVSLGTLSECVNTLEEKFKIEEIIKRRQGRPGPLTPDGMSLWQDVKAYFAIMDVVT